jgi:L-asparaginase
MPVKGSYSMLPFLEKCREEQKHVVITSQAAYDAVELDQYASGRAAKERGALSAGEMTMEATITKVMHLLHRELSFEQFRTQFLQNLAGERLE